MVRLADGVGLIDCAVATIAAARRTESIGPMIISHELAVTKLPLIRTAIVDRYVRDHQRSAVAHRLIG